ncbi:MAG: hypothetical protein V4482_06400 [Pseudomonadota bacterium]
MAIQQKSLFGQASMPVEAVKPQKPIASPRAPLPSLDLTHGFDNTELSAEAVFWHRLIINQQMRTIQDPKSRRRFVRAVLSEMKIKQGRSTPLNLMRDMLLMKNLG